MKWLISLGTKALKKLVKSKIGKTIIRDSVYGDSFIFDKFKQIKKFNDTYKRAKRVYNIINNPSEYVVNKSINKLIPKAITKFKPFKLVVTTIKTLNSQQQKELKRNKLIDELDKLGDKDFDIPEYNKKVKVLSEMLNITPQKVKESFTVEEIYNMKSVHVKHYNETIDDIMKFEFDKHINTTSKKEKLKQYELYEQNTQYASNLIRSLHSAEEQARLFGLDVSQFSRAVDVLQAMCNKYGYDVIGSYINYLDYINVITDLIKVDLYGSSSEQLGNAFVHLDFFKYFNENSQTFKQFLSMEQSTYFTGKGEYYE